MTGFSAELHEDVNSVKTSSTFGDLGDGTEDWFQFVRAIDGADETLGATDDAAVTNPALDGTVIALLKGLLTQLGVGATALLKAEDAAYSSADAGVAVLGVRNDARTSLNASGDYTPQAMGDGGNAMVSVVPTSLSGWSLSNYAAVAAASGVIKASAGKLFNLVVYNDNAAARYLQLFNVASVPADTTVPNVAFGIPTKTTLVIPLGSLGRYYSTGISWCLSTTFGTKTLAGADGSVLADYI